MTTPTRAYLLLTHCLVHFGCRVVTAQGGEDGVRMAQEVRPDLITLDIMMPGVAGPEVLRQLRAEPRTATVPVLIVSVVAGDSHNARAAVEPDGSRVDFLDKPFTPEKLAAALRRNFQPR